MEKEIIMTLNHETAMKLWNKTFGKDIKAKDFSGREIAKGAYNDRNSEFGWNVDHILPQCKGGKTTERNLIICNIKTNDEKANKFPGFVANGKRFTIIKSENHYVIKQENIENPEIDSNGEIDESEETNFFDFVEGLKLYEEFKGFQTKKRFVGTIEIILQGVKGADAALTDFIETLFIKEDVQFADGNNRCSLGTDLRVLIKNYEILNNGDINNLLDKCVLLNTYMYSYFKPLKKVSDYCISFRIDCYEDRKEFYSKDGSVGFVKKEELYSKDMRLCVNSLVIQNSYAKEKYDEEVGWDPEKFYEYKYVFAKLAENLEKESKKK